MPAHALDSYGSPGRALLADAPVEALRALVETAAADAFAFGAAFVHANSATAEADEVFFSYSATEIPRFLIRISPCLTPAVPVPPDALTALSARVNDLLRGRAFGNVS